MTNEEFIMRDRIQRYTDSSISENDLDFIMGELEEYYTEFLYDKIHDKIFEEVYQEAEKNMSEECDDRIERLVDYVMDEHHIDISTYDW